MEKIEDDPIERQARKDKHAAWLKSQNLEHASRVELVRRYLINPSGWPDGLDLPHWKTPHEIWYTGNEQYWNALAQARQAEMDKGIRDTNKPISSVTENPLPVNTQPV